MSGVRFLLFIHFFVFFSLFHFSSFPAVPPPSSSFRSSDVDVVVSSVGREREQVVVYWLICSVLAAQTVFLGLLPLCLCFHIHHASGQLALLTLLRNHHCHPTFHHILPLVGASLSFLSLGHSVPQLCCPPPPLSAVGPLSPFHSV